MSYLEVQQLAKNFGAFPALQDINFQLQPGEFVGLIGPSGCGKTTLLRALAGLENPSGGRILLSGKDITAHPARERPFHMVFQSYALFPHLNVRENIAFPLRVAHWSAEAIDARVSEMLELVRLQGFAKRRTDSLSGGQSQRVALARALASRPSMLLLDEPLSALDPQLRDDVRAELKELHAKLQTTFVMVTHDANEAFELCSRIFVMKSGCILQSGAPEDIYRFPQSIFVADFLGELMQIPLTNLPKLDQAKVRTLDPHPNTLCFRPENLHLGNDSPPTENNGPPDLKFGPPYFGVSWAGRISDINFRGSHRRLTLYVAEVGQAVVVFDPHLEQVRRVGDEVGLSLNLSRAFLAHTERNEL